MNAAAPSVVLLPVPAITGILCFVDATTLAITDKRSSSLIVAGSPVDPHTMIASVPCVI